MKIKLQESLACACTEYVGCAGLWLIQWIKSIQVLNNWVQVSRPLVKGNEDAEYAGEIQWKFS